MSSVPLLLSVNELKNQLGGPVVVDGSWHMPAAGRDPYKEFKENGHIPGARYFDIESIKDKTNQLPHMMPTATQFAEQVGELGITNDDHVVIYDTVGFSSAGRVYWMLKAFGHEKVSILNGGFKAWTAAGYPIEKGEANITPKNYAVPTLNKNRIKYYDQVLEIVKSNNDKITIIDARPAARFTGAAPEPRTGLSSGHMPGAKNVPFMELSDLETGELYNNEHLLAAFKRAGVNVQQLKDTAVEGKEIILTCGSGVTASALYFALEKLGVNHLAVFDGSWTEYASRPESIIVKDV
ncbi:rhodanese family protein [Lobosporangium transversale]|uniref:Rhodanese family protein n=1 Tax=Lobosporangium transversale TaxID=64571 RepID=A0A1Y2GWN8_9FUNG|nr:rhodanese family protein [Lobosporangium transversale]ORZ26687.1 rhodanese family protein [Lobosporangium transversale]|eukprot:XP_021884450.1 rhodanese family protein [Lobosporangium transversale]